MEITKAVVFTHVDLDLKKARKLRNAREVSRFTDSLQPSFKSYLQCSNVGLVYVYVDIGTKLVRTQVEALKMAQEKSSRGRTEAASKANEEVLGVRASDNQLFGGAEARVSLDELDTEQRTRNCVKMAIEMAREDLKKAGRLNANSCPEFQVIGLPHLTSLFVNLFRINPNLITDLAGPDLQGQGRFGYDSPKFVEAVIRLARGEDPQCSAQPILRFDADVRVNESGIAVLLSSIQDAINRRMFKYDFFSGGYGHGPGNCYGIPDAINDYAVRVHWLAYPNTDPDQNIRECAPWVLDDRGYSFLRDLGEIGATQIPGDSDATLASTAMKRVIQQERENYSANRSSGQVISGAGLYMSHKAIQTLPPFTNFANLTTWVDDHLKRRLHQALGHIGDTAWERIPGALFRQDRHPEGISADHVGRAKKDYFERLLRGCVLHSLIMTYDGTPGLLVEKVIEPIVNGQKASPSQEEQRILCDELRPLAKTTAETVLKIWSEADYGSVMGQVETPTGGRGTDLLKDWAAETLLGPRITEIVDSLLEDVLRYVTLVAQWANYVKAIGLLTPADAFWLFKSAD